MRGGAPRTETPGREDPTRLDGRRACRASPERRALRDGFPTPHRNRQSVVGGHSPRTCRTPVAQAPSRGSWRDGRWHAYWTRRLMAMRRASIHVTSRPLRYHPETIAAQDGSSQRVLVLFPARKASTSALPSTSSAWPAPANSTSLRYSAKIRISQKSPPWSAQSLDPPGGGSRSPPRILERHRHLQQEWVSLVRASLFAPPGPGSVLRARPWGPRRYAPRPRAGREPHSMSSSLSLRSSVFISTALQ